MMKRCRLMILAVLLAGFAPVAETADFKVVVNTSNPISSITTKELSGLFLKKDLTWPDGQTVSAVDLRPDSPVRIEFTTAIHGKKISAIKSYWQRQIFQGKAVPPMERSSEADVLAYVAAKPGGVGYVSSATALSANVKELVVEN
jgi:ABC-type phosphate transport system substrate-binding protein